MENIKDGKLDRTRSPEQELEDSKKDLNKLRAELEQEKLDELYSLSFMADFVLPDSNKEIKIKFPEKYAEIPFTLINVNPLKYKDYIKVINTPNEPGSIRIGLNPRGGEIAYEEGVKDIEFSCNVLGVIVIGTLYPSSRHRTDTFH